jgi:hypothetical protein
MKLTIETLPTIVLASGNHDKPEDGMCLLEAAALFAGEKFDDSPACVDPVIAAFGRAWNDGMRSDEEREQLKQYIPLIVGTRGTQELSEKRAWMATDWLIRVHTAAWLALTPALAHHSVALSNLPPITCTAEVNAALPLIRSANKDADAARAAARAAAGGAAWTAARAAARAAARDAAWTAAGDAAWTAAGAAARAAAWTAARAAARAAARDAAWDAVRAAAWTAAGDALEPTVKILQASAHDLLVRMIEAK